MNIQPYDKPPRHWPPKLTPFWFHVMRHMRDRDLRKNQIQQVEVRGLEHLDGALRAGHGVLLTPNHSFHFDSYCLLRAADQLRCPFYIMTAWQVFGMASPFGRWIMQRSGCFSVNREGADLEAFKTAVDILQTKPNPLVIFPEGDVYHTNERITPFREGAAAIAISAARKADRPVVCLPAALKCWYTQDPMPETVKTLQVLEQRVWWRPADNMPVAQRIYRLAEGLLALKEYELLGASQQGTIAERIKHLAESVLGMHEQRLGITQPARLIPERVKEIRRRVIDQSSAADLTEERRRELAHDMNDMFFVTQLYSYPGDYLVESPSVERLAETVDKLEEDVLGVPYPSVRAARRCVVQLGAPVPVDGERGRKGGAEQLTVTLERAVQGMLDQLTAERP